VHHNHDAMSVTKLKRMKRYQWSPLTSLQERVIGNNKLDLDSISQTGLIIATLVPSSDIGTTVHASSSLDLHKPFAMFGSSDV
jgi:hypothetical protein